MPAVAEGAGARRRRYGAVRPPGTRPPELLDGAYNLVPAATKLHRRLRDAGLGVLKLRGSRPQSPPSCWSLPTRASASGASRSSACGRARCCAGRWATPAILTRSRPSTWRASARRRMRARRPPFTGGAVGFFGYDLVRTVEPLGEAGPDQLGLPDMALMLSDVLVIFDHLKHTVTILVNADLERRARRRASLRGGRTNDRRDPPGTRRPRAAHRAAGDSARRRRVSSPTCRVPSSKPWSSGSCATSMPATPSRSCPPSAGRRRCQSRRSRFTGACARSTPRPICIPGLRRLPGRRRQSRAAAHGHGRHV